MSTDTATLIRRSARLEIEDIDFDSFRCRPLDSASLRCLRYMHDVEGHTMCYLRDVLATRAHRDPDITAFLACWSYEEHWHGDAIAKVLETHDEVSGSSRLAELRRHLPRRDGLRPMLFTLGSAITNHLVAVHMTWGAVNEWSTQSGYGRLVQKARNPVLGELLGRIMRQEGRHIDFYASQARRRLAESRVAQRVTRFALQHLWAPVGSGVMPASEVGFLASHLFGDDEGVKAARRIDRKVDRLPGLDGLHLVETAVANLCTAST